MDAISFVMDFYDISKEDALTLYSDEIDAIRSLEQRGFFNEKKLSGKRTTSESSLEDESS